MAVEFSLLIALAALVVLVPVVKQLRAIGPRVSAIRQELGEATFTRELRYTIREVVVHRDGKVVGLPLSQPQISRPARPLRAAA